MDNPTEVDKFCCNIDHFARWFHMKFVKLGYSYCISPISIHSFLSALLRSAMSPTYQQLEAYVCPQGEVNMKRYFKNLFHDLTHASNGVDMCVCSILLMNEDIFPEKGFALLCNDHNIELIWKDFVQSFRDEVDLRMTDANVWITDPYAPEEIDKDPPLIFLNRTDFTLPFLYTFSRERTCRENYRLGNGEVLPCNIMTLEGLLDYARMEELEAEVVNLPFSNPSFSMLLIQPSNLNNFAFDTDLSFPKVSFKQILTSLRRQYILLKLPKFMVTTRCDLAEDLREAGLNECLSAGARYPAIRYRENVNNLRIDNIIHKCSIAVNEFGVNVNEMADYIKCGMNPPPAEEFSPPRPEELSEPVRFTITKTFMFAILYMYEGYPCPIAFGRCVRPEE